MVSLKDISAICHVSVPTVSKALNGRHDVSEKTRQMILQTARELDYTSIPDAGKGSAFRSCAMNLGILMPPSCVEHGAHYRDRYISRRNNWILRSFWETATKAGFDLTILNTGDFADGKMSYEAHCKYRKVDGLCVFDRGAEMYEERMMDLFQNGIPVVTLDQPVEGHTAILSDYAGGVRTVVRMIAETGCQRFAYLEGWNLADEKLFPLFKRAAAENGISMRNEWARKVNRDWNHVYKEVRDLFAEEEVPDCIVLSGAFAALEESSHFARWLEETSGSIPVFLYGDADPGGELFPQIVSVTEDRDMLGKAAAENLIFSILNPETAAKETVLVPMVKMDGGLSAKISR